MKKRIIGSNDPFMNLSKITELITNKDRELIPDYEIIVSQEEVEYENSGIYNNISLKNSLSLNNVSSVRIMKDPETKIKSAVITIVDFNKQLINVDDASTSISVKVDINGKVEYFIVEAGDKIKIRLGYAKEMKYAFNGYITAINSNGNIIEIICSSLASGLYSENIPELQLGPKSFLSKTANFVHSIFQSSERTEDAIKSKIYNPILYNDKTLNDHLLNITGENNNEVLKESELSSMYNVFLTLCATLSSTFKDKFLSKYSNNNSVIAQFMLEQLSKTFGKVDEQTNPNNKDTSIEFYQNIYNVDADYEVYGFVGDERTPQADTSEKTTDGFVRSPEKLVDGETKYTVDIEETQKASSIAGMEFGNWLFGSKKTNSSTLSTETTTTSETVEIVETTSDAKYIAPCSSRRITSKFGMRVHPVHKQSKFHNGIDIGPTIKGQVTDSDKIIATADGIVSFVKTSSSAGYYIAIEHADGVVSRYLHLKSNSALVKAGEKVKQGQVIAMMGATGQVNGPHLHFDLTIKGKKVDPVQYIEDGKVDWTYS
jgi:murein DD-endopeptidase MepM/ murein hydrolase activator NlpD